MGAMVTVRGRQDSKNEPVKMRFTQRLLEPRHDRLNTGKCAI